MTTPITDTTAYPAYANKEALLAAIEQATATNSPSTDELFQILARLSNTNTGSWADPTARHDD